MVKPSLLKAFRARLKAMRVDCAGRGITPTAPIAAFHATPFHSNLDKIIERTAAPVDRSGDTRPADDRGRSSGGLMDMAASMLQGDDRRHDRYYDKHRPKKKKSLLSEFFD